MGGVGPTPNEFLHSPSEVWEALGIDVDGLGATGRFHSGVAFRQDLKRVAALRIE